MSRLPHIWTRQAACKLPLPPPLPDALVCSAAFAPGLPALGWPLELPQGHAIAAAGTNDRRYGGSTGSGVDCSAALRPNCCAAGPSLPPGLIIGEVSTHLSGRHGSDFDCAVLQQVVIQEVDTCSCFGCCLLDSCSMHLVQQPDHRTVS